MMQKKKSAEIHGDEREIAARRFIEDDDFIKTLEFRDFWTKMKIKEIEEKMELGEVGIE